MSIRFRMTGAATQTRHPPPAGQASALPQVPASSSRLQRHRTPRPAGSAGRTAACPSRWRYSASRWARPGHTAPAGQNGPPGRCHASARTSAASRERCPAAARQAGQPERCPASARAGQPAGTRRGSARAIRRQASRRRPTSRDRSGSRPAAAGRPRPARQARSSSARGKPARRRRQPSPRAKPGASRPPSPAPRPPAGASAAPPRSPPDKPAVSASQAQTGPSQGRPASRTTGRRLGQVLIDLGYIDDDQLWEILDEAKNAGKLLGQAAIARGPHHRNAAACRPSPISSACSLLDRRGTQADARGPDRRPRDRWPASTRCCRSPYRTAS